MHLKSLSDFSGLPTVTILFIVSLHLGRKRVPAQVTCSFWP